MKRKTKDKSEEGPLPRMGRKMGIGSFFAERKGFPSPIGVNFIRDLPIELSEVRPIPRRERLGKSPGF
jgi:hypothetical protein